MAKLCGGEHGADELSGSELPAARDFLHCQSGVAVTLRVRGTANSLMQCRGRAGRGRPLSLGAWAAAEFFVSRFENKSLNR